MKAPVVLSSLLLSSATYCPNTVNQDCDGQDLANAVGSSAQECCDLCSAYDGCHAYVFVSDASKCYLKSSCVPKSGCTSGTCTAGTLPAPAPSPVPTPPPSPPGSCSTQITSNSDCTAADIGTAPGYSTDDCCAA